MPPHPRDNGPSTDGETAMMDAQAVARVLSALAGDDGEPGQRAWTVLAGMTTRMCGPYSAEARAVAAARGAAGPDPAAFGRAAGLLARRAQADARFAAGFGPWLGAAQMLLSGSGCQR
jgi:hypothetical protein